MWCIFVCYWISYFPIMSAWWHWWAQYRDYDGLVDFAEIKKMLFQFMVAVVWLSTCIYHDRQGRILGHNKA